MNPARLRRLWVLTLGLIIYAFLIAFGVVELVAQAPQLLAPVSLPSPAPLRGEILAADGTPLALSLPNGHRIYPLGDSASQLVGFGEVTPSGRFVTGLDGVESSMNAILASGRNVQLTINPTIQAIAERALWAEFPKTGARWGTAIVMDARTGALLAVANAPAFHPNQPRSNPQDSVAWRNNAFLVPLEPGSTEKVITSAVLLQVGAATLHSRVWAPMQRTIEGWTIHDVVPHPPNLTLEGVLRYSSNVGMSLLADRISPKVLYDYFVKLHYTDPNILPGAQATPPIVRPLQRWRAIEFADATFGQGFLITPLQLAAALNAVANDGVYVLPRLFTDQPIQAQRVFRRSVSQEIRRALSHVIIPEANLAGYALGGKTGTAQVVVNGHYSNSVYTAVYGGFVPAKHTRATVVVIFFDPKGDIFGSFICAPVYRQIAAGLLAYWGIPPDSHNRYDAFNCPMCYWTPSSSNASQGGRLGP
jgi:cell division protein FtsI (penicillin-binding protein 3)